MVPCLSSDLSVGTMVNVSLPVVLIGLILCTDIVKTTEMSLCYPRLDLLSLRKVSMKPEQCVLDLLCDLDINKHTTHYKRTHRGCRSGSQVKNDIINNSKQLAGTRIQPTENLLKLGV